MTAAAAFRGQPLLLLVGVIGVWMALRLALWEAPLLPTAPQAAAAEPVPPVLPAPAASTPPLPIIPFAALPRLMGGAVPRLLTGLPPAASDSARSAVEPSTKGLTPVPHGALSALAPSLPGGASSGDTSLVLVAPPPPTLLPAPMPAVQANFGPNGPSRWSGDGWLLLRQDTSTPLTAGSPSYGRSQAGAIVRYRLAPASRHRPEAYLRGSMALAGAREQEVAAGVSARPLRGVPVRLAVEARLHETGQGTEARPAVYAVSEFPPVPLALGLTGELYVQAGYVGGEFATAFADGQGRVYRRLARLGGSELSMGAAAWGGAQKSAERLDIGPTLALMIPFGAVRTRIAADYRWRVAGDAEPASGPALTVSAGF